MSVESGIMQLLRNDPGVGAIVSMINNNGVYGILAPKGAVYPFLVVARVMTSDTIAFSGDQGMRNALFQVDCYASQFLQSRQLAQAVRNLLKSYRGNLPDAQSTPVAAVLQTRDWDLPFQEGTLGFVYRAMLEFRVWYYDTAMTVGAPAGGPGSANLVDFDVFSPGTNGNNQTLFRLRLGYTVVFPAGASGSRATAGTAIPSGSVTYTYKKNGVAFATVTFSSTVSGGLEGTFTQASSVTFAPGDLLELDAPATANATLADIGFTLEGTKL